MIIATRMSGHRKGTSTSRNHKDWDVTFHVRLEKTTFLTYCMGRAYHWYDMRIPCRIPGWHRFEQWLKKHGAEHRHFKNPEGKPRLRDRLYGWTVEQDLRCFHINDRKREMLLILPLTKEQYEGLA